MAGMQLLFCVETDNRSRTDIIYITETIERFFEPLPNTVKKDFITMGGKGKYNTPKIRKEIAKRVNMYSGNGATKVFICVDTDSFENNPEHQKDLENVIKYCNDNGYEFIWFCHDIEEVYLGNSLDNKEKKEASVRFKNNGNITKVKESYLTGDHIKKGHSNILSILKKYLT